jgi:hypothetical protein
MLSPNDRQDQPEVAATLRPRGRDREPEGRYC